MKLTDAFTDREHFYTKKKPRRFVSRRDADFVCEIHTARDAKNFLHATSLPHLFGCLVACGAMRILRARLHMPMILVIPDPST